MEFDNPTSIMDGKDAQEVGRAMKVLGLDFVTRIMKKFLARELSGHWVNGDDDACPVCKDCMLYFFSAIPKLLTCLFSVSAG